MAASNITVKVWEYEKDGQTKGKYQKIGVLIQKDDGSISIRFDEMFENYLTPLLGDYFGWWANVYQDKKDETENDMPF